MEKQISELNELDENEIASMIYDRINAYWGKFPNIWKYVSKDDMATQTAMDLYRPRKADGVPHIIHYYNTRGERSLKPLIGMIAYNVLIAEARDIHSTGVFNKEARRNLQSPLSLEMPLGDLDEGLRLEDTISDEKAQVDKEVDYIMLFDSIPDKEVDGVYYKEGNNYKVVSYKYLLQDILDGYTMSQIGEKLYRNSKRGGYCKFNDLSTVVKSMKQDIKEFLESEYEFTEEKYKKGYSIYD